MRTITREEVRSHLFQAHHLVTPADSLPEAAGVCGFQNSPPGTWLCAAFNRLRSCSAWQLQQELDEGRGIMQAWSLRGAPWIFPLHDAAVYLDALCAEEGESWIYTNGLRCCQKEIGVPFSVLLQELMQCLQVLEKEPVVSKQRLDQVLAAAMLQRIPASLHSVAVCFSICERAAVWRGDCFLFAAAGFLSKGNRLWTQTEGLTYICSLS